MIVIFLLFSSLRFASLQTTYFKSPSPGVTVSPLSVATDVIFVFSPTLTVALSADKVSVSYVSVDVSTASTSIAFEAYTPFAAVARTVIFCFEAFAPIVSNPPSEIVMFSSFRTSLFASLYIDHVTAGAVMYWSSLVAL